MTLIIVAILILGYILIATSHITNVNKAAVSIFMCTVGWVLYISYGTDFVMSQHPDEYAAFLNGAGHTSSNVKMFIADNIYIKYVGKAAEIMLFLLSTMTIVGILLNNGCFDFLREVMLTRKSRKLLWIMSALTFLLSANLDNFTTTSMMLVIMHTLVASRRQRILYGCAIVIAANCGGALTVIGDPTGLFLWTNEAVTATNFSMSLAIPCLLAWAIPTWMIGRQLPETVSSESFTLPYRGDDTNLNRTQRLVLLFVGIGGLWFIPTFHSITKLSPFLGALCVLAVLWVVNEIFNRKLMNTEQMIQKRFPRALQYGVVQMMLFVVGIMLALGVVRETGILTQLSTWIDNNIHNVWILGIFTGLLSSVLDNFASAVSMFALYPVADAETINTLCNAEYMQNFVQNGLFWKIIAFTAGVGGNILIFGSMSGMALIKLERLHIGWYIKNVGMYALVGLAAGLAAMALLCV